MPLDFAEEILPAEAVGRRHGRAEPRRPRPAPEPRTQFDEGHAAPDAAARTAGFPHVYQLDEMDCGAACLALSAATSAAPCRSRGSASSCTPRRDGTSLLGITRGAEELGLDARTVRASKSNLDRLPLPAIVHWEGNHWVVLYAVGESHVRVADPARGLRRLPRDEFLEKWSGYAALLGPTPRLEELPEAKTSLAWLKPFLRPHRGRS